MAPKSADWRGGRNGRILMPAEGKTNVNALLDAGAESKSGIFKGDERLG